ncbi:hypothetical protein JG688_00016075 [Phytophthora aleatoria]|uniref:SET domain-containing protein n=1 Tax=Phytophthora aleatoria TaxID=2496075 RepID=A0A8J5LWF4_9STRA|nr:hypothetical protein JG688_00016075 [Phytophthora aleatoria]
MPQQWPIGVVRIERSVFSPSKPYPVIVTLTYGDEFCECEGCCVSNTGSLKTSPCLNVNTATVCSQNNCLFGPACGNRFEPRLPLDLVESRAGLSVVSSNQIPEGAFIVEYIGEILYEDDVIEQTDRRYQAKFKTDAKWNGGTKVFVDTLRCESRFINHSCRPNCALYEFMWANTTRLGIFAVNEIPPLRELTFAYAHKSRAFFLCQCSAHTV